MAPSTSQEGGALRVPDRKRPRPPQKPLLTLLPPRSVVLTPLRSAPVYSAPPTFFQGISITRLRPPRRVLRRPYRSRLRLGFFPECSASNPPFYWLSFIFFGEGGFGFQERTSCPLLPARLRPPRRVLRRPYRSRLRLGFFPECSASNPPFYWLSFIFFGEGGFEPPTSSSQSWRYSH